MSFARANSLSKFNKDMLDSLASKNFHKRGSVVLEISPLNKSRRKERLVSFYLKSESSIKRKSSQEHMPTIHETQDEANEPRKDSQKGSVIRPLYLSGLEKNTISLLARRLAERISGSFDYLAKDVKTHKAKKNTSRRRYTRIDLEIMIARGNRIDLEDSKSSTSPDKYLANPLYPKSVLIRDKLDHAGLVRNISKIFDG
uniref:Uncharacterized protein n=1 Tax=Euplotes harpa TaxID=151035 RepID=A0A7S3N6Y6_9SPIT|mmetsp:Transcript_28754/g.32877  ORF Transcript_28754/g.32877 Transcript_28754/m.32877 type:complete len:200 (+) Transcript_28754:44-643(+)